MKRKLMQKEPLGDDPRNTQRDEEETETHLPCRTNFQPRRREKFAEHFFVLAFEAYRTAGRFQRRVDLLMSRA